jgi:hypothetical protein
LKSKPIKNKPKFNFYLNRSFLASSDIDEEHKYRIKQIYAIERINLIIKKTREFLYRKNRKNS